MFFYLQKDENKTTPLTS